MWRLRVGRSRRLEVPRTPVRGTGRRGHEWPELPLERCNRVLGEPRGAQSLYRIGLGWSNGDRLLFCLPCSCHSTVENPVRADCFQ